MVVSRLYLFRQNKIANYKFLFFLKGILKKFHTLSFSNCMNFKYIKKIKSLGKSIPLFKYERKKCRNLDLLQ